MFNELCIYCGNLSPTTFSWNSFLKNNSLCESCRVKLQPITPPYCEKCCRMLEDASICFDCARWENDTDWTGVLSRNISLYRYNDFLKEIISRYKYRGDYALASLFTDEIKRAITTLEIDFYVPIPLSEARLYERGFNQSEAFLTMANLPASMLLARNHSEKQSKKSRKERLEQSGVFECRNIETIEGKQILIIDDIYTTGSTIRHASKVLKEAGAVRVISLTIAR